jgi:hypothetical protein
MSRAGRPGRRSVPRALRPHRPTRSGWVPHPSPPAKGGGWTRQPTKSLGRSVPHPCSARMGHHRLQRPTRSAWVPHPSPQAKGGGWTRQPTKSPGRSVPHPCSARMGHHRLQRPARAGGWPRTPPGWRTSRKATGPPAHDPRPRAAVWVPHPSPATKGGGWRRQPTKRLGRSVPHPCSARMGHHRPRGALFEPRWGRQGLRQTTQREARRRRNEHPSNCMNRSAAWHCPPYHSRSVEP